MGSVFRKQFTKPIPDSAETIEKDGQRFARWRDAKGKLQTAPLSASGDLILVESAKYTAKYRDGAGVTREVATGCKDLTAAKQVLANLEKRADGVRAGIRTADEDATVKHHGKPLASHYDAYAVYLKTVSDSQVYQDNARRFLDKLATECKFTKLADLRREQLEAWLVAEAKSGRSARSRNAHRDALVSFCNWCIETNRLTANPFAKVAKADEKADPRRKRRALTEEDLIKLLDTARRRLVRDALLIRRGKRKGEEAANIRPEIRRQLESQGEERALLYKTLLLTGLRRGELASLTVKQIDFKSATPCIILDPKKEKNREGNSLPLRADLAADLKAWLAANPQLKADSPLFKVPSSLLKTFDRDLAAAGIPKRDERGRTLDVHALRTSFITLLSKGGVAPRTAQAAARHSDVKLTMGAYTDEKLLDVQGALEALPAMPLNSEPLALAPSPEVDACGSQHAPIHAPTIDPALQEQSSGVNRAICEALHFNPIYVDATSISVNENSTLTTPVNVLQRVEDRGVEPLTSSMPC